MIQKAMAIAGLLSGLAASQAAVYNLAPGDAPVTVTAVTLPSSGGTLLSGSLINYSAAGLLSVGTSLLLGIDGTPFSGARATMQIRRASDNFVFNTSNFGPGGTTALLINWTPPAAALGIDLYVAGVATPSIQGEYRSQTFALVPEPQQYALVGGLGLVALGAYRRFRT